MFCRFGDTLLTARHRADLAGQPYLTKYHQILRQRSVAQAGDHCQQQRQVRAGFRNLHPTNHIDEHILIRHLQTAVTVQHRQQDRQAVLFQTDRHAPRVAHH